MKQFNLLGTKGRKINVPFKSASRLFVMVMMLLATALQVSAQENEAKMYVEIDRNYVVATFYYDNLYDERNGYIYNIKAGYKCHPKISKVVFDTSFSSARPTSTAYWFSDCEVLKEIIGLENLNTSNVTNMSAMFQRCSSLTKLNVSNFNTSNVTDMRFMFSGCEALANLDVSNFNTSNVTDMHCMYQECNNLTDLDVSRFNTSNVTNMNSMFSGCKALIKLDVGNFNTDNVTNMSQMFYSCSGLTKIDVSKFNTSNVTDMTRMFSGCSSLINLDVSKFNTNNVTEMHSMFNGCKTLTSIDLSNFETSNITNMSGLFNNCEALTNIDLTKFNTSNVTNMSKMFNYCEALTSIKFGNFDTGNVTDMSGMFYECNNLTNLDVSKFNTGKVTDMRWIFFNCSKLPNLDVSKFDTGNVTTMDCMFFGCSSLTSLDVSKFNTSKVTDMSSMFGNCKNITSLDVSNFNTENVTTMFNMFCNCSSLTSLDVSKFNTSKVTDMRQMFLGCGNLTHLNLKSFNIDNVTKMNNMFGRCSALESIFIGEDMMQFPSFSDCKKLKKIVSYLKEPYVISNCFAKDVYETTKLYVPNSTRTIYTNTDGWKDFKHIVSKDLEPKDDENAGFGKDDIDENTDLDGNIVRNIFFNVPAEAGEYVAAENCIILKKATTDEQVRNIFGLDMFDEYLLNNFIGMIFMVDAGSRTIELEAETVGEMQLNVMIGTAEPITRQASGKSKVSIPYDVAEPTLVYVYGNMQESQSARGMHKANTAENALKIYSAAWGKATGIRSIYGENGSKATIYNMNGQRVKTLGKGLYIVNGKKVIVK